MAAELVADVHQHDRRVVVGAALVLGALLVAGTLRLERGSPQFYLAGFGLAVVWTGAFLLARPRWRPLGPLTARHAAGGMVVAGVMFGVFVVGAWIGRHFAFLRDPIDAILRRADGGSLAWVLALAAVNGFAEELFFRGALTDALPGRSALAMSTVLYAAVTAVGGNTALTLAAAVMGAVFALERWRTDSLTAPITTHVAWTALMILAFPR